MKKILIILSLFLSITSCSGKKEEEKIDLYDNSSIIEKLGVNGDTSTISNTVVLDGINEKDIVNESGSSMNTSNKLESGSFTVSNNDDISLPKID